MIYWLYCSSGNTAGIDEYVCYSEISEDGYWNRYVEIRADGAALRYNRIRAADSFGVLPEGTWNESESSLREYGTVSAISSSLFEAVWLVTNCANVPKT